MKKQLILSTLVLLASMSAQAMPTSKRKKTEARAVAAQQQQSRAVAMQQQRWRAEAMQQIKTQYVRPDFFKQRIPHYVLRERAKNYSRDVEQWDAASAYRRLATHEQRQIKDVAREAQIDLAKKKNEHKYLTAASSLVTPVLALFSVGSYQNGDGAGMSIFGLLTIASADQAIRNFKSYRITKQLIATHQEKVKDPLDALD